MAARETALAQSMTREPGPQDLHIGYAYALRAGAGFQVIPRCTPQNP